MLTMVYVLVKAGEGDTESIIVANSKTDLLKKIDCEFQIEIDYYTTVFNPTSKDFAQSELDALRQMVKNHDEWKPGEYILDCIEPIWQEWTLHIEEIEVEENGR